MKRIAAAMVSAGMAVAQNPLGYSVPTPRPINPAEGTTTPSAQATQRQNPFLGSRSAAPTGAVVELSLAGAIERGLRYNLGLIESSHASADVRADRLRALSALLPQVSAVAKQSFDDISFKEIGVKLPPIPGFALPPTSGGYGYQDARVRVTEEIYNAQLRGRYQAQKSAEEASIFSIKDSRDVVVFAVGAAYLAVIASQARVDAAKAQLGSAQELDRQTADRVTHELSPEIESLRAQVEKQTAEQRLRNAQNRLEKDKLTLGRITGLAVEQRFVVTDSLASHAAGVTYEAATEEARGARADLKSAEANVRMAESTLRAQKAQRLPVVSIGADYGGGGTNVGNFNQVYTVAGSITVPIYTGGRIHADIEQAQADLARKQAELADIEGRIGYDVKVAWLDMKASEAGVKVAENNRGLAAKALAQARDRYANGVTNELEVIQAEEALASAGDNYVESLYSFNLAVVSLARAMGGGEARLYELMGGK